MAFKIDDRVRETTVTTGTGTVSLQGAVPGFQTFVSAIGDNNTTYYAIVHRTADEWELGVGTVDDQTTDTLARTTVLSSSNSDSAVSFSAGVKDVFVTTPASKATLLNPSNGFTIGTGAAGVDYTLTFDGESNDGVITWMEDEDYFQFSDDILMSTTEKVQFRDTALYIHSSADGQLDLVADTEIQIAATTIDINGAADISGNLTVNGTLDLADGNITNVGSVQLDSIAGDADTNTSITFSGSDVITMATGGSTSLTLNADQSATFSGAISGTSADLDGGVTIDNITIDGTEIDLSSGDLTIDVAGDIILDADGANVTFKDNGTSILDIANNSSDVELTVSTADKNFKIKGTDSSSAITALDIDMALAGKATFNGDVVVGGDLTVSGDDITMGTNTAGHLLIADGTNFNSVAATSLTEISTVANDDVFLAVDTSGGGLKKITRSTIVSGLAVGGVALSNVVEDTTPQLGGNLDMNGQDIVTTSNADLELAPNGTGHVTVKGNTNSGAIQFNCESNSHGQIVIAQPHSAGVTNTLTLPAGASSTLVSLVSTDTLTNKTLTSPKINEDVAVTSTATELNLLDGITAGTVSASLAVIADSNKDISGFRNVTLTGELDAATLDISGNADIDGTTNLDNTDIDGTLVVDGSNISLDSTSTLNIDNSNTSNGVTIGTATSGVPISIGHSTSEVTVNDNLTVTGNFTVSGTSTTVDSTTVAVADSMFKLAKDQGTSADALDFGFYGQYGVGGTAKFAGVFRDVSATGDPFTFFDDLQAEPGTTVNTSGTGYDLADIAAGGATFADNVTITGDADVDGTLEADAITVNGTALNTVIAGVTVTNATTAAVATTVTISDNESTNEDNAIIFTSGGDVDGGNIGLESDGDLIYNPSTGRLTATQLAGTLQTAAQANVTSLGTLTTLTVDNVIINGSTIGHTGDTDLMTVASGVLTVAGEVSMTTLDIGGTNVAATAAELNIMDGGTAASSTTLADADRVVVNDNGTMKQVAMTDISTYTDGGATALAIALG